MYTIPFTNYRILLLLVYYSIHVTDVSLPERLDEEKRRAFWWKRQANTLENLWNERRISDVVIQNKMCTRTAEDAYLNVPPVVNPPWDAPIPKFNSMILTRMGDIDKPICSGALISYSFVVTVGMHCVFKDHQCTVYSPDDLIVRLITSSSATIEEQVKKILVHPGCCHAGNYLAHNDIALLQLETQIFEKTLKPAGITKRTGLYHPSVTNLWDLTNCRGYHLAVDFRDAIWFIRTRFISADTCDELVSLKSFNKLHLTCTSYYHVGSKDCQLDQGSPLSYLGQLIGLLVHKSFCGGPASIALFVNIGLHSNWIRENVKEMSNKQEKV